MNTWSRSFIGSAAIVAAMILPGMVSAGGDFGGVWQPYSRPAEWLGTMTVAPDRLSFATGLQATLEPVRAGGSVFRITAQQGDDFLQCGQEAANYVGFHVLENGQLARVPGFETLTILPERDEPELVRPCLRREDFPANKPRLLIHHVRTTPERIAGHRLLAGADSETAHRHAHCTASAGLNAPINSKSSVAAETY